MASNGRKRHPAYAVASAFTAIVTIALLGSGTWYWNKAIRHETAMRKAATDDLLAAKKLVSKNELNKSHEVLVSRIRLLDAEPKRSPELEGLYVQTKDKLAEVNQALTAESIREAEEKALEAAQTSYRHFLDRRKEALFRDTDFTGLALATDNLELTRKAALEALGVFGNTDATGDWTLGDLPKSLSNEQRTEIKEGCYELLLVLADAIAGRSQGEVDRALRVLESADRLRPGHSRAYYLKKASCLTSKGDKNGADRALSEAQRVMPTTALDFFLIGRQKYKSKQYSEASQEFAAALGQKPSHFWANGLQAICFIQRSEYEGAKGCLQACLTTDPDFAWLYLLRGYTSGKAAAKDLKLAKNSPGREGPLKDSAEFKFNQAELDFQKALDRLASTPDEELHYTLLVNRGLIRFERGMLDQAVADYQEAIRLSNDRFIAYASLAAVYEKKGKTDLAVDQFTRAIAVAPSLPGRRSIGGGPRCFKRAVKMTHRAGLGRWPMLIRRFFTRNPTTRCWP